MRLVTDFWLCLSPSAMVRFIFKKLSSALYLPAAPHNPSCSQMKNMSFIVNLSNKSTCGLTVIPAIGVTGKGLAADKGDKCDYRGTAGHAVLTTKMMAFL